MTLTEPGYDAATAARLRADAQEIMGRYPQARSALLPMLHLVQSEDGYVSPRGIALCAELLDLTAAEVSAVVTFYSQYKRHPNGTYSVGVCTNTLCAVLGGDEIFARVSEHLGVGPDETTEDGAITLERIECNAACDYAPVVMVNWEFFDNMTPSGAIDVVERLRAGEDVAPTRGAAKVCTFKEISRVLAGFPDGRSDEGVGAGSATLEGLRLARERGWSAPELPRPAPWPVVARGSDAARPGPAPAAGPRPGEPAAAHPSHRRSRRATAEAWSPAPGEPQSSAQRPPTTPADTDARTTTSKRPEPTRGEED